jgi:hypothetical protein
MGLVPSHNRRAFRRILYSEMLHRATETADAHSLTGLAITGVPVARSTMTLFTGSLTQILTFTAQGVAVSADRNIKLMFNQDLRAASTTSRAALSGTTS